MNASEWFHLVGLVSTAALGIGFITGIISVALSWRINREQAKELAQANVQIEELRNKNLLLQRDLELLHFQLADPDRSQAEFESHFNELVRQLGQVADGVPVIPRKPRIARRNIDAAIRQRMLVKVPTEKFSAALGTEPKGAIEIVCAVDNILKGEPHEYASGIADALGRARWTVQYRGESPLILPTMPPIMLIVEDRRAYGTSSLARAFGMLGVLPEVREDALQKGRDPLLIVGLLR